jgi:hypothetical protein
MTGKQFPHFIEPWGSACKVTVTKSSRMRG